MKYAQKNAGEVLHLVADLGEGRVSSESLCGATPDEGKGWGMIINVPLGNACPDCTAAFDGGKRFDVSCKIINEQETENET